MPSIPLLGSNGRLWDLTHASIHDAFHRLIDNASSNTRSPEQAAPFRLSMDASGLGNYSAVNASAIYEMSQRHTIQVLATVISSISLTVALCAIYWFCMMRRNFRRDLVLLLIVGGSWKSLWFMTFSVVTFAKGPIKTKDVFCQISGYGLQLGFESCDIAVLFMSLHMYLHIFPPSHSMLGHDGLYRIRHWIFAAWFLLPNLSAALAFVNPRAAYMAQGAFCSLPLRPFWYRLALFWIPRYMIWLYVVFVAVRIYRHVGSEFKVFGQEKDIPSSDLDMPGESSIDRAAMADQERMQEKERRRSQRQGGIKTQKQEGDDKEHCAPDDVSGSRKVKAPKTLSVEPTNSLLNNTPRGTFGPNWSTGNGFGADSNIGTSANRSNHTSRGGSKQIAVGVLAEDFAPPPVIDANQHRGSINSVPSVISSTPASFDSSTALPPIREGGTSSTESNLPRQTANEAMQVRRRAIQRELRLLFIYPCLYLILWVIPFAVNVMNYNNYWAQHPVFGLELMQLFCLTIMTFVDVNVFCWRERPWRHIPGSDGTFLGSFMCWRYCFGDTWIQERKESRAPSYMCDEKIEDEHSQSQPGVPASLKRWSLSSRKRSSPRSSEASRPTTTHRRTFSGGSDLMQLEAERARERLALERADYEQNQRSLQQRRASVISKQAQTMPERKEWFDLDMGGDLFADQDHEKEEKRGDV